MLGEVLEELKQGFWTKVTKRERYNEKIKQFKQIKQLLLLLI